MVAPSEKRPLMVRFDRETELFCRPSASPPPGALKIVFQLEMLSDERC